AVSQMLAAGATSTAFVTPRVGESARPAVRSSAVGSVAPLAVQASKETGRLGGPSVAAIGAGVALLATSQNRRRNRRAIASRTTVYAAAPTIEKKESRPVFPFSAIVGQAEMKLSLILNVVDPKVGGVMIMGDRGTGKTTTIR
ncbi:unnamed protein product, partial [Polarella glacialis]